jgi:predicted TIM-barrel fold metal-dependent hydrolase
MPSWTPVIWITSVYKNMPDWLERAYEIIDTHTHLKDGMFRGEVSRGFHAGSFLKQWINIIWTDAGSATSSAATESANTRSATSPCMLSQRATRINSPDSLPSTKLWSKTLDEIKRCAEEYGFRGLKLHPGPGFPS